MKINYLERSASIIAAIILLPTLFFKFTGSEESVYIFSTLGAEPWGRYLAGVSELVAGLLLLYRKTSHIGAGIGIGVISGAILSHLAYLGIEVMDDGGYLFGLAIVVFVCCAVVLWQRRLDVQLLMTNFRR